MVRIRKLSYIDFAMSVHFILLLWSSNTFWDSGLSVSGVQTMKFSLVYRVSTTPAANLEDQGCLSGDGRRATNYRATDVSMQLTREPRYCPCGMYHATGLLTLIVLMWRIG